MQEFASLIWYNYGVDTFSLELFPGNITLIFSIAWLILLMDS